MQAEDVPTRAAAAGEKLAAGLLAIDGISAVRGLGLLLAAELESVPSAPVAAALLDAGVIVNAVTPTALRLAPPLLISDAEITHALSAVATAVATAVASSRTESS
jgi:acetylornithine/succinyldiaminopimelate/putrescine aminotransferase